jgi:predicted small lipoprotein YifL
MSPRRLFRLFRAALLPFLLCLLAAGCGQKGDLYLPGGTGAHSSASGSG